MVSDHFVQLFADSLEKHTLEGDFDVAMSDELTTTMKTDLHIRNNWA